MPCNKRRPAGLCIHVGAIRMSAEPERDHLARLYEEHFAWLSRIAFLITGSTAAAEDAVHEVFVRIAGRAGELEHPPSYLRAAVVNECRSQYRKAQRRIEATAVEGEELPHDLLETRDALGLLTPRQRAAVVLRYFVDLPDDEIARILGCRPATVRSLIHRALPQLEEALR